MDGERCCTILSIAQERSRDGPENLYKWCCYAIVASALLPSLIIFCFLQADAPLPSVVQEMRLSPYYPLRFSLDGQRGVDLYHTFIFAEAWSDGFSPYGPIPDRYFQNYQWDRTPVHPPFTYFVYRMLVPLGFPAVRTIHTIAKLALFFLSAAAVLWSLRAEKVLLPTLLAILCCIFLSPTGLSELERGQSELFIAASFMLVFAAVFRDRALWLILAGIAASLKISSLLFLGPFVFLAFAVNRERFGRMIFVIAVVFFSLLLFFPFLSGFARSILVGDLLVGGADGNQYADGVSFALLFPYYIGKSIIIASTMFFLGIFLSIRGREQRTESFLRASFPLAVMLILQAIGFRTLSWEYKSVEILALLPGLYLWLREAHVSLWYQRVVASSYGVLLMVVSHLFPFKSGILFAEYADMARVYFIASCLFSFLALVGILSGRTRAAKV
ncbi:hypothetical protein A2384_06895 [Candidatus Peribacteria bacterium RIFOXYB1_FULL_54_35]|nr:MAG: hypothetical protein A2384_06895 [Candidatus Peribacteria bacterium RIFOXYB1_FULL_54_35]